MGHNGTGQNAWCWSLHSTQYRYIMVLCTQKVPGWIRSFGRCRASDHMLAVKTLVDKYTQTNQKLYTCFIDFSKAFDTVWRDALFYKLLKGQDWQATVCCKVGAAALVHLRPVLGGCTILPFKMGIGGPFAKLLKDMYNKSSIQIALQNGLSEPYNIGVKQGCVLSPTLFKIFLTDMGDIFNSACQPAQLFDEKISYLMFADDAVLISESAEGLQHALDKIKEFSDKWLLRINTEKTKIMIFNKSGKLLKDGFTLGNVPLQNVNSYTYLGLMFVPSESFNQAVDTLCRKASKAMFKLRQSLNKLNVSPKLSLQAIDDLSSNQFRDPPTYTHQPSVQQKVPFSLIRCSSSKVAFCSCMEWGWHIYNIVESESDPLTRRPVDLFEKEPLKGNSEVHLHTPTKFGEDWSKDLGGDREQTDRQTDKQTNAARFIVWFLYDSLIRPICTYASEVWGSFIKAKHQAFNVRSDKYELFDKHCFEKLELKFCKAILGIHKKASNAAVRGELGRYPTLIYILKQVLKNWFRITSYEHKQSILYNTYMCNLEMHHAKKCCWWSNIRNFFKEF